MFYRNFLSLNVFKNRFFFYVLSNIISEKSVLFLFNITLLIKIVIQVTYANNNTKTLLIIPIFTLLAKNAIIYITYNAGYSRSTANTVLYI